MFLRNWARLYSSPTKPELRLEVEIAKQGKRYRAQHPFFGIHAIVDFALLDDMVIIEVDGKSHLEPGQRYKDITRSIYLEGKGWKVIRFTNEEALSTPAECIANIEDKIRCRPSLLELEEALRQFPEPPAKPSRPRARRKGPARVKALKRQKSA